MKTILLILLASFSSLCFAQKDSSVLIVPMKSNMLLLDKPVLKMLKHNKVSLDTIYTTIHNLSVSRLKAQFPGYKYTNLKNDPDYSYLIDSLDILDQWNSFYIKKIQDSKGIDKIMWINDEGPASKYYGRVLEDKQMMAFKELQAKHHFTYLCFINKFETITRRPFSSITYLCLHFEIYDQQLNKIYGGASYWPMGVTKSMYISVFTYSLQKAFDDYYARIKKYLM